MPTPVTVVLVEGASDRIALRALAPRLGHDLDDARVEVIAMSGITNLRAHALRWGPRGAGASLVGLYDVGEEDHVRRGLVAAGLPLDPGDRPADLDFHACDADLEDELRRALGVEGTEALIELAGEGSSLRRLAQMPAQQGWTREAVLRRFMGSQSGRKARYAQLCVEAMDLRRAPAPLVAVLEAAVSGEHRDRALGAPT